MILVTGGAGFLGTVLTKKLVENGEKVRVLALKNEDISSISSFPVEIVRGDIRNESDLEVAFENVDKVFHLASMIAITSKNPEILYDINVNGAVNVAKKALEKNVKSMVYVSSIHSLADITHGITIDETIPVSPINAIGIYGKTKAIATLKILDLVKSGLHCKIVCPSGIIGPFDYRPSRMGRLILDFMKNKVWYTLDGGYNFVDVRDVAKGCILAMEKGKDGEIYLLSGEYLSFKKLFGYLSEKLNIKKPLIYLPSKLLSFLAYLYEKASKKTGKEPLITFESLQIIASNSIISTKKAESQLGYHARPIDETLNDTVEWFKLYFSDQFVKGKNKKPKISSASISKIKIKGS
ncbi:MAG: NAD-dependent epimerase/dehydratase family protein [Spirochaetota bacterium]